MYLLLLLFKAFQGYYMHFLKNPIYINSQTPVTLMKCRYNYQVIGFVDQDIIDINQIIKQFDSTMNVNTGSIYMNGKTTEFKTNNGSDVEYADGQLWTLSICIQGYKTSLCSKSTPVWKIVNALKE